MPYLGVAPNPRENREVDDISGSFNGSTTAFTLQAGGSNVSPGKDTAIIVSLGGVVQNPGTDYTIAASTITFTTAPASGLSFFGVVLAQSIDIETVADNTVTTSKLVDGAVTNAKVNASAAIAGTKISPDFGSQNIVTTGIVKVGDGSASAPALAFSDDTNTGIFSSADNKINFTTGGTEKFEIGSETIFNENGEDIDFRIEGDTNANLFFLDAGNNRVSIGTASPISSSLLEIQGSGNTSLSINTGNNSGDNTTINFGDSADADVGFINYDHGTNKLQFAVGANLGVTIDANGRLGLGTAAPDAPLEIFASNNGVTAPLSANNRLRFRDNDSTTTDNQPMGTIEWYTNDGNAAGISAFISVQAQDDQGRSRMVFGTGQAGVSTTERMRIDKDGRVLINTNTVLQSSMLNIKGVGVTCMQTEANLTSAFTHHIFNNPNGQVGDIRTSGSSTIYNTSSDYRLKENVVAISDGITRLKTLKPYRFNFKADTSTTVDGFFAHEVTAVPEAISGTKDEVDADNKPVYQGIDQSKLVPLLTAALQEAVAKIETLETKVAALEAA